MKKGFFMFEMNLVAGERGKVCAAEVEEEAVGLLEWLVVFVGSGTMVVRLRGVDVDVGTGLV